MLVTPKQKFNTKRRSIIENYFGRKDLIYDDVMIIKEYAVRKTYSFYMYVTFIYLKEWADIYKLLSNLSILVSLLFHNLHQIHI